MGVFVIVDTGYWKHLTHSRSSTNVKWLYYSILHVHKALSTHSYPLDNSSGINSDGNFSPWVERVDTAPNSCDRPERILSAFTLKEFLQTLPGWPNYYIGVLGQGSGWSNWGIITKLRTSNRYHTAVTKSKLRSKNTSRKCSIPPSIKHSQCKAPSVNEINGAILEPLPHAGNCDIHFAGIDSLHLHNTTLRQVPFYKWGHRGPGVR